MAVVLSTEERNYFSTSGLRRSHSQPKFGSKNGGFHASSSSSRLNESYHQPVRVYSDSAPSSAPSSPRTAHVETGELTGVLSPPPKFPFAPDFEDDATMGSAPGRGNIILPQYEAPSFFHGEDLEPPPSPKTGDSYTASPNDQDTSTSTSRPESPDLSEKAEDDTAVRAQPSRHVDYLSHNWREEDIWESWKYIISKKGDYSNAARLENASWRTWMKSKNKLKTVSPEALNWLKDCDVTWLYGPLQTGTNDLVPQPGPSSTIGISEQHSFANKKPILKKRSMSEIMLQRSLSASSLVKQAAAAVQAQQKEGGGRRLPRPNLARATTDYITFPFSSRRMSRENTGALPSTASSGIASPFGEKKHIHFNEQVEQCIAVDVKGDEEDDYAEAELGEKSDSDDGAIMMKRTAIKKRRPLLRRSRSDSAATESKTIVMLPSTTLKDRDDEDGQPETALKHSYRSPVISPSSSQETLRPSKGSRKLFMVDEDEDEDDEENEDEQDDGDAAAAVKPSGWRSPTKFVSQSDLASGMHRSGSSSSLTAEPAGMRRTESGMFMPFEEGQPAPTNEGLLGRVIDTVNTARDIAHVIWNVGWRK